MKQQELIDWLRLIRHQGWTSKQKGRLVEVFDDASTILAQENHTIRQIIGRARSAPSKIPNKDIELDLAWIEDSHRYLITLTDSRYPKCLKEIPDPPIALFVAGQLACLEDPKVAIVGSRRPTPVGCKMTSLLAGELAALGLVVTSGMALGVDGLAHQAALDVSAPTIAVMGCGLDTIYPARNKRLFNQIQDQGCLISEFPIGIPPLRYHFPMRNRIVSGLSLGVVIVEAAERSGTLVTARLACEQNRELMVVPGTAFSTQYAGSHRLLKDGAALITTSQDVLHELSLHLQMALQNQPDSTAMSSVNPQPAQSEQGQLLRYVGHESTSLETIILASGLTSAEVSSMLLILEVDGVIAVGQDGGYVRLN